MHPCLPHQRLRGRYNPVTMTMWLFSKYTSSMSLSRYRQMCCCFGGIFVTGCTGDCLFDNIQCSWRRRLRRNRHAFILWLTTELLMSPLILITESFTPILSSCCDTTDWFILTWFHSISLYFILNITLINIILTVSVCFTLSLPWFSMYFYLCVLCIIISYHCLYVYMSIYLFIYLLKVRD